MLTLFKTRQDRQPPRIPPNLNNIKQVILSNVEKMIAYWREMNWAVKSEHILNTLLTSMYTGYTDPLDIYDGAMNQIGQVANPRGIIHNLHYGRVQPINHFYGNGNIEIIVHQPFDDSIELINDVSYLNWDSVRVMYHPFTALDLQLADGKPRFDSNDHRGYCILKVDIALLFTQYQLWLKDDTQSKYPDGTAKTTMNFIHSVVLPNILKTHVEQVWFNRFIYTFNNGYKSSTRGDRRLALPDPYQYIDDVHRKLKQDLMNGRGNFHEWLCSIPGLYKPHFKAHLMQDAILETQQIELVWALAKYGAIKWLVETELVVMTKSNGQYRNELIRAITAIKNDRTFGTIRGLRYHDVEMQFDELYRLVAML